MDCAVHGVAELDMADRRSLSLFRDTDPPKSYL